jgi:hypothetical protein
MSRWFFVLLFVFLVGCTTDNVPEVETLAPDTSYQTFVVGMLGNTPDSQKVNCGGVELTFLGNGTVNSNVRLTETPTGYMYSSDNLYLDIGIIPVGNMISFNLSATGCTILTS